MTTATADACRIGFLSVVELPEGGSCGGLLVLNALGRPIEFHCTAPVIPNRMQRILFGESLKASVLNDSIGRALVARCSDPLRALLTDAPLLWELGESFSGPLFLVREAAEPAGIDVPLTDPWEPLELHGQCLGRLPHPAPDAIEPGLLAFAQRLSLAEPFERIRNAIAEAQSLSNAPISAAAGSAAA